MSRRAGLTVLELMLGLTVVALVASIGTATLSLFGDERSRRREPSDAMARQLAMRRTIVNWLEGAHASVGPAGGATGGAFQLVDSKRHERDADVLTFTTAAWTPLSTGDATVRLYVDEDRSTPEVGLTAELTSWPGGPATRVELDSSVTSLDVVCLTNLLGGRRWVPSWMSTSVVPRGIKIRLRGARNGALPPVLQMPIVVAVEGGR
jgi:type II secretory pathway component PulJ